MELTELQAKTLVGIYTKSSYDKRVIPSLVKMGYVTTRPEYRDNPTFLTPYYDVHILTEKGKLIAMALVEKYQASANEAKAERQRKLDIITQYLAESGFVGWDIDSYELGSFYIRGYRVSYKGEIFRTFVHTMPMTIDELRSVVEFATYVQENPIKFDTF